VLVLCFFTLASHLVRAEALVQFRGTLLETARETHATVPFKCEGTGRGGLAQGVADWHGAWVTGKAVAVFELELGLKQFHVAQKPITSSAG